MKGENFQIGLENYDTETREKANNDFVSFWAEQAKKLSWFKSWEKTLKWEPPFARWFVGGSINASYKEKKGIPGFLLMKTYGFKSKNSQIL